MSKEKIKTLTKYVAELQNKLSSPPSAKQKNREKTYKAFLTKELSQTTKKLEALKLTGDTVKGK